MASSNQLDDGNLNLAEDDHDDLNTVERIGSVLSLVGCLFVLVTFCCSKAFHKPINRLVFYATFGNAITNIGTLMARSYIHEPDSAGCQAQAFLIQMFMPADAFWILAMAINVYLTFYYKFDGHRLRRMEIPYIVLCYGIPFVPAMTYLFLRDGEGNKVYGNATLWCWVSREWGIWRIITFYGPVWLCIVLTVSIYIRTGGDIWQKRKQLRDFSSGNHESLTTINYDVSKYTEVTVTTEVVDEEQRSAIVMSRMSNRRPSSSSGSDASTIQSLRHGNMGGNAYSIAIAANVGSDLHHHHHTRDYDMDDDDEFSDIAAVRRHFETNYPRQKRENGSHRAKGAPRPAETAFPWGNTVAGGADAAGAAGAVRASELPRSNTATTGSPGRNPAPVPASRLGNAANIPGTTSGYLDAQTQARLALAQPGARPDRRHIYEANNAAWSYAKCALLFFTALIITWIPSSTNRVYSVVHNHESLRSLEFMSASVLPLQGFWNSVIYIVTSWNACKTFWTEIKEAFGRKFGRGRGADGRDDGDTGGSEPRKVSDSVGADVVASRRRTEPSAGRRDSLFGGDISSFMVMGTGGGRGDNASGDADSTRELAVAGRPYSTEREPST